MAPSFDIQPSRGGRPVPKPAPRPTTQPDAPRPAPRTIKPPRVTKPKKKRFSFFTRKKATAYTTAPSAYGTTARALPSLRDRRKTRKKRQIRALLCIALVAFIIFVIATWQAPFRIISISADGPHAEEMTAFAKKQLSGTRHLIFPKDSILFIPRDELRSALLKEFPDVEAVSLNPDGLTGLHIAPIERASAFWWCGTTYEASAENCFDADTSGKIFRQIQLAATTTATTTDVVDSNTSDSKDATAFRVFGSFSDGPADGSPIGSTIDNHYAIPQLFRFIKAVKGLGANVVAAQIRGDEADLYTAGGTRITYVLGKEDAALGLAASAFPSLDVGGSSLLYVDLRFASKVYFKRRASAASTTPSR